MKYKWLYWSPRILVILFTAFVVLFASDVFSEDYTLLESLLALFIHLIPVYILVGVILIAWNYELIGGIIFILFGLLYFALVYFRQGLVGVSFVMILPLIVIGILFILNKKKLF
jgi:hypothetical protein